MYAILKLEIKIKFKLLKGAVMRKKITKDLYVAMISVALEEGGYETEVDSGGYIKAYSPNNNLIIFPVSRCLSNKKMVETTMISAEEKAIAKLVKRAEELADEYIPCIGFGVGKYGYFDSEVCVVPVEVWKQKAERGSVFSNSSGKYYYNYDKAADKTPDGAILRIIWKAEDCK